MDRPCRKDDLAWRRIDGLVVIVDPASSTLHDLSEVASFYWVLMDGQHTIDDLLREALAEFDTDEPTARQDLTELVAQLADKGLLAE